MKAQLATNAQRPVEFYLDSPDWVGEQKIDGHRVLIHVVGGDVSATNRNGERYSRGVPSAVAAFYADLRGAWVLDGELLDDQYHVFDLLMINGVEAVHHPFEIRRTVLAKLFESLPDSPWVHLVRSAIGPINKRHLYEKVRESGGEGLVFKHRNAPYRRGQRVDTMVKYKLVKTADVIVKSIRDDRAAVEVAVVGDNGIVDCGSINMVHHQDVLLWLVPGDVIEVKYLYASDDHRLVQGIFQRVRDDKHGLDCKIDQLEYACKTVIA